MFVNPILIIIHYILRGIKPAIVIIIYPCSDHEGVCIHGQVIRCTNIYLCMMFAAKVFVIRIFIISVVVNCIEFYALYSKKRMRIDNFWNTYRRFRATDRHQVDCFSNWIAIQVVAAEEGHIIRSLTRIAVDWILHKGTRSVPEVPYPLSSYIDCLVCKSHGRGAALLFVAEIGLG